ncbi:MAG: AGE family epimerase/isomerase [Anaerolineales bacterium]|nr:AGE family epimerase/isomerase [Anaerolineales bacterium]
MLIKDEFRKELKDELTGNILPFWIKHAVDPVNGGFYGAVTNDLQVLNGVPRSAVLCARILWAYSAAYRVLGGEENLKMARRAYDYLTGVFWDPEFGGLYFDVDLQGRPVIDRKHHYAQAFGLYGLSEFHRAAREPHSLKLAQSLFELLEQHAFEPVHGGYREGGNRRWEPLSDSRLSEVDLACAKSMNTNLHILEAYTNLLRVWDDPRLKAQHRALLETFLNRILDPQTDHFRLFFDDEWNPLSEIHSYGHDIEASWLLWEAAGIQADADLREKTRGPVIRLAEAVLREAVEKDGSVVYEGGPQGVVNTEKALWTQVEAMVGFYNASQIAGREEFAEAAHRVWRYIRDRHADSEHGEWFKLLSRDGKPVPGRYKIGPWDCPYHSVRACLEMMARLGE